MSDSSRLLHVQRPSWTPEHLQLLCGIANAGGGVLVVESVSKNISRGMGKIRRSFEQIPQMVRRELGISCTTHPVLDGVTLCLEINVPVADVDQPIKYRRKYWYYNKTTDICEAITIDEIRVRREKDEGTDLTSGLAALAQEDAALQAKTLNVENLAAALSSLVTTIAKPGDFPTFRQEGNSIIIEFSSDEPGNDTAPRTASSAPESSLDRIHPQDNTAPFTERSFAAANGIDLTSTDEYVLWALRANGRATAPRIGELLGVSESTVRRSFRKLVELHMIERVGSNRAGYWIVTA